MKDIRLAIFIVIAGLAIIACSCYAYSVGHAQPAGASTVPVHTISSATGANHVTPKPVPTTVPTTPNTLAPVPPKTVPAPTPTKPAPLPFTGADVRDLAIMGVVLLLLGAGARKVAKA